VLGYFLPLAVWFSIRTGLCKGTVWAKGTLPWLYRQESCAIAKMTARCALYNWIEWAVAEISPFEIMQDGGLLRRLGFDVTGNSAILSADPENPTLEPNMKCIGSPVVEIWRFAYLGGIWNPHFGGRGGRRGQLWHHFKERWWFLIGSPLWPLRYL